MMVLVGQLLAIKTSRFQIPFSKTILLSDHGDTVPVEQSSTMGKILM